MAFPTIPTTGAGRILTAVQANGTSPRTFPDLSSLTKNSGDLLLALIYGYQSTSASPGFGTWGGGFGDFGSTTGGTATSVFGLGYKFSTGSETGTFTVAQTATITGHAAMILMSIPGAHSSELPAPGTVAHATTAADPGSLNPANWDVEDTLWISLAGIGETGTGGAFTGLSASPTNYSGDVLSAISQDAIGGAQIGVGFRQLAAASEDPGGWTLDTSNARNSAILIAVRPAPVAYVPRSGAVNFQDPGVF
jgi:hypothetical protein